MHKVMLTFLAILVLGTAPLAAQSTVPAANADSPDAMAAPLDFPPSADLGFPDRAGRPFQIWGQVEYLLWWVKGAPLPVPLVTTGNPSDPAQAAIGGVSTRVLLGDSSRDFGVFSGLRAMLGAWLDSDQNIGIEGSGFFLGRRSNSFAASSDSSGNPVLALPYFERAPGAAGESRFLIAFPATMTTPAPLAGNVSVASTLQLWGAEANAAFCLWRNPGFEWTLLAGFRYAELREGLTISSVSTDYSTPVVPTTATLQDNFNTRNQFYGGQLGTRFAWQRDRLAVEVTGALALGGTHEVVDVNGSSAIVQPGFISQSYPYGFYAEPSNSGRHTANQFTVMPSVNVKLGYQLTQSAQAFIGYNCLYWNQVVRPGDQIDRNINTTQNAAFGATNGALTGPVSPTPLVNRTDFWAQGINFGLEFRY